jgi:hypothetical protein
VLVVFARTRLGEQFLVAVPVPAPAPVSGIDGDRCTEGDVRER